MNGVLIISTTTGACLYSKAHSPGFGYIEPLRPIGNQQETRSGHPENPKMGHIEGISMASMLYVLNLQASAAFSSDKLKPGATLSKSCLNSFLTVSGLLQFAADDACGILACVSLSKTLRGATAEFMCQEVLKLFISQNNAMLASGSLKSPARGFTACLHSLYQQIPQRVAQAMACKLVPMQVLWAVAGPVEAFVRADKTLQASSCWPCYKRSSKAAPPQRSPSYQVLLTSPDAPSSYLMGSEQATLPGTHLLLAEVVQMIATAAQRLTRPSPGSDTYVHDLIPVLRSMAVPLQLPKGSMSACLMQQAAAAPAVTPATVAEYTPRMVQLSLADDMVPGNTHVLAGEANTPDLQHWLLVMHWDGYVVALPVQFGGHVTHAQQAKTLIAHETQQLIEVLQSLVSIIPMHTTAAVNGDQQDAQNEA